MTRARAGLYQRATAREIMERDPTRRGFVAAIGAATATTALRSATAIAADQLEFTYHTAGELTKALVGRQVSSRELVDSVIARIEALDAKINAVVVRDFDRTRQVANLADAARARDRPLLGLPMTVKEQFNIAGLPTTWDT